MCIRKPIIATCSLDKTIRVWNYENKSVLLSHFPHTQQLQSPSLFLIFHTHTHTTTYTLSESLSSFFHSTHTHTHSSLDLHKEYPEEAHSVALHPSGLFVLVGFSEKLRLMSLLINDIRPYKEFPIRGCREVLRYIALVYTA